MVCLVCVSSSATTSQSFGAVVCAADACNMFTRESLWCYKRSKRMWCMTMYVRSSASMVSSNSANSSFAAPVRMNSAPTSLSVCLSPLVVVVPAALLLLDDVCAPNLLWRVGRESVRLLRETASAGCTLPTPHVPLPPRPVRCPLRWGLPRRSCPGTLPARAAASFVLFSSSNEDKSD